MTQQCTDEECRFFGYCPDKETPENCQEWLDKNQGDDTGLT